MDSNLTKSDLARLLKYDPETGQFIRLTVTRGHTVGTIAGGFHRATGYVRIKIDYQFYPAHRLAWLYMTGEWPQGMIDHINQDRSDNRWINLRLATSAQNKLNARKHSDNSSGFKGVVCWNGKWKAQICIDYKTKYLGIFADKVEAAKAYDKAAVAHFGEYAHTNFDAS